MKKWEYLCKFIDLFDMAENTQDLLAFTTRQLPDGSTESCAWFQAQLEKELNRLGQEGWEVITVTPEILNGVCCAGNFLMKRPLQEPSSDKTIANFKASTEQKSTRVLFDPNTPIQNLQFSTRARNCLYRGNIATLGQLLNCSERDVRKIQNMGQETIRNIKTVLASYGLSLRDERALPLGPIREGA